MNAEYVLVARQVTLEAVGGNDAIVIPFEVGTPYRHLTVWAKANTPSGTPDVDYQAVFMGVNEGAAVTVTDANPTKVFQAAADEIRPPTRPLQQQNKHPDDSSPPIAATFAMDVSNDGATPVTINIWIMAAAAPGGS